MVAGWVREGLPADPTSVQNGAILTSSGEREGAGDGCEVFVSRGRMERHGAPLCSAHLPLRAILWPSV